MASKVINDGNVFFYHVMYEVKANSTFQLFFIALYEQESNLISDEVLLVTLKCRSLRVT